MRMKPLILCLFFIACTHEKPEEPSAYRASELAAKKAFYCAEGQKIYDARKFMVARCDALLFTALWVVGCGHGDVDAFEDPTTPGYWHRNPARDCYVNGKDNGAKSSISKDQLLGLMLYSWKLKRHDHIQGLIAYGEANGWFMGDAIDAKTRISRTLMTPALIDLLYLIQNRLALQEPEDGEADAFFINKGYQAHLDVIRILLEGSVKGTITATQGSILKAHADREPSNALFLAAAARYGKAGPEQAANILLDSSHFPNSRLPSKAEHCEPYLFQRDQGTDWEPCGAETELHDGVDLVVAAAILDGTL